MTKEEARMLLGHKSTQAGGLPMRMAPALPLILRFEAVPLRLPSWPSRRPYSHLLDGFLLVVDGIGHPLVLASVGLLLRHFFPRWHNLVSLPSS